MALALTRPAGRAAGSGSPKERGKGAAAVPEFASSTLTERERRALGPRAGPGEPAERPRQGTTRGEGYGHLLRASATWACQDGARKAGEAEPASGSVDLRGVMCARWDPFGGNLVAAGMRSGACKLLQFNAAGEEAPGARSAAEANVQRFLSAGDGGLAVAGTAASSPPKAKKTEYSLVEVGTLAGARSDAPTPVTAVAFRPVPTASGTKNLVLSGNTVGHLRMYHATSGKLLWQVEEAGNQVYAIDYRPDGRRFATGGKDCHVRVYDDQSHAEVARFQAGDGMAYLGHTNNVYSVRWHPADHNVLFSSGWDKTVKMWDCRQKNPVRSVFGVYVCGDAMDVTDDGHVLAGSWRSQDNVQLWDLRREALLKAYTFETGPEEAPSMMYAAKFLPGGNVVTAGGSGSEPSLRFFNAHTGAVLGTYRTAASVLGVDFNVSTGRCAMLVATADAVDVCVLPAEVEKYCRYPEQEVHGARERGGTAGGLTSRGDTTLPDMA